MTQDHYDAENEERRKVMVDQIREADKAYLRTVTEWEKVKTHLSELFNRSRALFSTDREHLKWAKDNFPRILQREAARNIATRAGSDALQRALSSCKNAPNRNLSPN